MLRSQKIYKDFYLDRQDLQRFCEIWQDSTDSAEIQQIQLGFKIHRDLRRCWWDSNLIEVRFEALQTSRYWEMFLKH